MLVINDSIQYWFWVVHLLTVNILMELDKCPHVFLFSGLFHFIYEVNIFFTCLLNFSYIRLQRKSFQKVSTNILPALKFSLLLYYVWTKLPSNAVQLCFWMLSRGCDQIKVVIVTVLWVYVLVSILSLNL